MYTRAGTVKVAVVTGLVALSVATLSAATLPAAAAHAAAAHAAAALAGQTRTAALAGQTRTAALAGQTRTAGARTAGAAQVCPGVSVPEQQSATADTTMDAMFSGYADNVNQPDHWTGADGTYSAALPGNHELWIFSDTFLGTVNPDGTRSPTISDGGTTPFINNSFVEQPAGDTAYRDLATIHGGSAANPTALMPPPDASHWYWAGDALATGSRLQAVYQEYGRYGTGAYDWKWTGNVLATYKISDLSKPVAVTALPSASGVAWGVWLMREGAYTYVYGVEDLGANKYLHLARVHGHDIGTGAFEYFAGTGAGGQPVWSAAETASIRLPDPTASDGYLHVANEFSVSRLGGVYVLITQDAAPLSPDIDAYYACTPYGPFADRTKVYTEPEMGHGGKNGTDANVFTYNAHAHPEVSSGNTLVISYNENSFVNTDLYSDASIYAPRFIDVKFRE